MIAALGWALFGCADAATDLASRQQIEATCRSNIKNGGQQTFDQCVADTQRNLAFIASHPPAAPPSDQPLASAAQILSAPYPALNPPQQSILPQQTRCQSFVVGNTVQTVCN